MAIVYRGEVFRPLTYDELDSNFRQLDDRLTNIDVSSSIISTVDSAYVNLRVDHPENVSEFVNDAGYLTSSDAIDADTLGGSGKDSSYYLDYNNLANTPTIPTDNSQLTNGAGYLDSAKVDQMFVENNLSAFDSASVIDVVDSAYFAKFGIDDLKDVNLSASLLQDQFLQWNGTQWHNVDLHLDPSLEFHGVVDLTSDTAPSSPANGDMYVNNAAGTVGSSWTGINGDTAGEGDAVIWSVDDSRWYLVGGSAGGGAGGVIEVSGGTGITVTDSPDHQYISVAADTTYFDNRYAAKSATVNTSGNQSISGTKTFSSTIQGNISGSAGSAASASTATTATTATKTQASLTINGTAFNGQTARSFTFPTTDTKTAIRGGSGSYLTGNVTIAGSGSTSVSQSGSTITVSSSGGGTTYTGGTGISVSGSTIAMKQYVSNVEYTFQTTGAASTLQLYSQNARGAEILFNSGSTNGNKYLRAEPGGSMSIVNGAYSSVIWYVDASGNMNCTGDVVAYSDERLKENVTPARTGIISQLQGVEFDWIEDGKKSQGLIAQEVQKVLPELVMESESLGKEGMLTVNYIGLIPYLIEEIKALRKELEALK